MSVLTAAMTEPSFAEGGTPPHYYAQQPQVKETPWFSSFRSRLRLPSLARALSVPPPEDAATPVPVMDTSVQSTSEPAQHQPDKDQDSDVDTTDRGPTGENNPGNVATESPPRQRSRRQGLDAPSGRNWRDRGQRNTDFYALMAPAKPAAGASPSTTTQTGQPAMCKGKDSVKPSLSRGADQDNHMRPAPSRVSLDRRPRASADERRSLSRRNSTEQRDLLVRRRREQLASHLAEAGRATLEGPRPYVHSGLATPQEGCSMTSPPNETKLSGQGTYEEFSNTDLDDRAALFKPVANHHQSSRYAVHPSRPRTRYSEEQDAATAEDLDVRAPHYTGKKCTQGRVSIENSSILYHTTELKAAPGSGLAESAA